MAVTRILTSFLVDFAVLEVRSSNLGRFDSRLSYTSFLAVDGSSRPGRVDGRSGNGN